MVLSGQQLIEAGRELEVPFEVELSLSGGTVTAECVELLRLVPERRAVVKMLVDDEVFLGKIFLGAGAAKYCSREKTGVEGLQSAGVKTAQLAGTGYLKNQGAEVLLLEYLPDVVHLSELVADQLESSDQLLSSAIEIIAKLHDQGLQHKDCHLDNFLVVEQCLYLVDGDAVSKKTQLSQAQALENLALFFVQLPLFLMPKLADLFGLYCQFRGWDCSDFQPQLDELVIQQRTDRQRRFLKKVYRDCTQFKVVESRERFAVLDREAETLELTTLMNHLDEAIASGELLKDGNSATVAKVLEGDKVFVVKRYNIKSFGHWLKRCWQPSRAWLSWRNAQLLAYYGVGTPKPLAMIEQRCAGLRGRAYFITEFVAACDALVYVEQVKNGTPILESLGEKFSNLFKVMELLRVSHGDFKGSNFLVEDGELTVIDLDSMQLHKSDQRCRRAILKDRQRFMKNWSGNVLVESIMAAALAKGFD